uniref:Retrovirus-related Pol polyprotein from transposon TNT 1-94-like beta-barrel domain-containing protein n=1 Tax=Cajanus cajan TaxID=3821 RepID=A0A151T8P9_CAJCA|nr:hypothetical protein KK1_017987 [Cajanus cajan]
MLPISFRFNVSKIIPSLWVLDSGATDHMTPSSKFFSTYFPCPSNKKIATADGTLITVAGIGNIHINPFITLKNVLHVPKLYTNLISVQKLTNDISCNVVFNNNCCVFQDKESGRTIGRARERNGLYLLEEPSLSISEKKPVSFSHVKIFIVKKIKNFNLSLSAWTSIV